MSPSLFAYPLSSYSESAHERWQRAWTRSHPLCGRLARQREPFLWILKKVQKLGNRQCEFSLLKTWKHFSHHSAACRHGALFAGGVIRVPEQSGHFARHFISAKKAEMTARRVCICLNKGSHRKMPECTHPLSDKYVLEFYSVSQVLSLNPV